MTRFRIILAALLALIGVSAQAQDAPLKPVTIFASFIPNVQFSPLYVAIEAGLFAEHGYEVEITYGDENIGVLQIAQGELPIGIISGEQVILARSNGVPVKYVYSWFLNYPQAVVATDAVTMETPADLAGLRVGIPGPFGANYTALTALLSLAGLTEDDIQLESIGYVAPDVMCAGGVDAAIVYSNNEPLEIQRRIDNGECGGVTGITVMQVGDFANMASNGLVTSEDLIANDPEGVAGLTAAFDGGATISVTNPARAYLYSLKFVENLPQTPEFIAALEDASDEFDALLATDPTPEAIAEKRAEVRAALGEEFDAAELAQFDVLLASIVLWGDSGRGTIDDTVWTTTRDVMAQMGSIPADFDISGAYTREFIPADADIEPSSSN